MPFERDAFEGKPAVLRGDPGVDEEGCEEGEESGQQEGQVRETRAMDLKGIVCLSGHPVRRIGVKGLWGLPNMDLPGHTLCSRLERV